jgi:hypothetical protein
MNNLLIQKPSAEHDTDFTEGEAIGARFNDSVEITGDARYESSSEEWHDARGDL